MQINQATKDELGLLLVGLEGIYVAEVEPLRRQLILQLRHELAARYGVRVAAVNPVIGPVPLVEQK
jgi:hypothetical protein